MSEQRRRAMSETLELTPDERDLARRWCILNCWGWPDDLPMPEANADRLAKARSEMAKMERAIGKRKVLAFWSSDEFQQTTATIRRRYHSE